jgi:endo-1,4-beta-D-glucanase Y
MRLTWLAAIVFLCFSIRLYSQPPKRPFPQHVTYAKGSIKPNHISQQRLDKLTRSFYEQWRKRYVRPGCHPGEYFVWFERKGNTQCVSEGQGYGMIITVLMAGVDRSAKATYDGLYLYYKNHPANHSYLMAWAQGKNCRSIDKSTATDGDMDIAYSLLLADKQWGSMGKINYRQEAQKMIASIMRYEINPHTYTILISDAIEYDSEDYYDTRSSDFMPANFKAFENATNDVRWKKVITNNYRLFNYV